MRQNRIWGQLLGVENMAVVESVELEDDDDGLCLVARVRKHHEDRGRCSRCMRRCPRYDTGSERLRWRALDLGPVRAFVEAEAPRLTCPEHGVVLENSPWAHGQGRFTRALENTIAWLATRTDKTAV